MVCDSHLTRPAVRSPGLTYRQVISWRKKLDPHSFALFLSNLMALCCGFPCSLVLAHRLKFEAKDPDFIAFGAGDIPLIPDEAGSEGQNAVQHTSKEEFVH